VSTCPGCDDGEILLRRIIGHCLRSFRAEQSRTLSDVARAAGVSIAHLSAIERGHSEPSSEVLAAICMALGMGLADLLDAVLRQLRMPSAGCTRDRLALVA